MTDEPPNGRQWTQHEREHETAERTHRREHQADQRAIEVAVASVDRRLDELNKLRAEVVTDRGQFVRNEAHTADVSAAKAEFRGEVKALSNRLDLIEKLLDKAEGAANTWRFLAGFLGLGGVSAVVWALLNSKP